MASSGLGSAAAGLLGTADKQKDAQVPGSGGAGN